LSRAAPSQAGRWYCAWPNHSSCRCDPRADELIAELETYLPPADPGPDYVGFAVPLRLRSDGGELRLITTLTSFATATNISLAELHLEAFLPADEATARHLRERTRLAEIASERSR
jgi:hypothetical protein